MRFLRRWTRTTDPPYFAPLIAVGTVMLGVFTVFFEPTVADGAGISGPHSPTALRLALTCVITACWLAETGGLRWPRMMFVATVFVPTVWLLSLGRAIVGTLYLVILPAWIAYVGTLRQSLLTLLLAEAGIGVLMLVYRDTVVTDWFTWLAGIAFAWFSPYLAAQQQRLLRELRAAQAEITRQAAAEERRRIAREVHDVIAHSMAIMMLHLTGARHVLQRNPQRAAEALERAERFGRQSLADIRRTVGLLRSDSDTDGLAPPLPGADDIATLVDDYAAAGLNVRLAIHGDLLRLSPAIGLDLYRITQEALTNVAKHAPEALVEVNLTIDQEQVQLSIRDSGNGTGGRHALSSGDVTGLGIAGMRERVMRLDGRFVARPEGDGWLVECVIPDRAAGLTAAA